MDTFYLPGKTFTYLAAQLLGHACNLSMYFVITVALILQNLF